ncbi:MAG: S9 family peptidase, partial [Dehalococcoidia bacterium]
MTRGMNPEDLYRIQWLAAARISSDGGTVAFTVTQMDRDTDDYRSAIWTMPVSGGEPKRFTSGTSKDSAPRWSPDGERLAFLSDRDGGKAQVYLIDASGGEARRLTDLKQGVSAPSWSPDGKQLIVFVQDDPERDSGDDGTSQKKPKTRPGRVITTLKYRANGEGFTYDRRRHLFIVDAESGETRQLTEGDWDDIQPAWSPDSRRIAFVSARHADRDYDRAEDIFVVEVGGGEAVQVTPGGGSCSLPAWSPDGRTIA